MIIQRLFSEKKKPEEPSKVGYVAQGIVLSHLGGKAGEDVGKVISAGRQKKEVLERIEEITRKASEGDKQAMENLSKLTAGNQKETGRKISRAIIDSPRTKRGGKIGKAVGIIAPATLTAASYLHHKNKYEKAKKN